MKQSHVKIIQLKSSMKLAISTGRYYVRCENWENATYYLPLFSFNENVERLLFQPMLFGFKPLQFSWRYTQHCHVMSVQASWVPLNPIQVYLLCTLFMFWSQPIAYEISRKCQCVVADFIVVANSIFELWKHMRTCFSCWLSIAYPDGVCCSNMY